MGVSITEKLVAVLKALGDEQRLKILKILAEQEMGVCEVIHQIKLSQPAISHHLKVLKQVELIRSEKQGKMIFYSLNSCGLERISNELGGYLQDLAQVAKDKLKPSPLRENPNLCVNLGAKLADCEEEL